MIGVIATSSLKLEEDSGFLLNRERMISTKFGDVQTREGIYHGTPIVVITRSGDRHPLEPRRINFRANLSALNQLDVTELVSTCVVGSLTPVIRPGIAGTMSQFIDFTRHHEPTIFDEAEFAFTDMTTPYCTELSHDLANERLPFDIITSLCYVGVDGPRYETAAEVRMFRLLGGHVVGHTAVTEAIMAREMNMCHIGLALVTNFAAGITDAPISNAEVASTRALNAGVLRQLTAASVAVASRRTLKKCGCDQARGEFQVAPQRFTKRHDS